jgi:hypothetical protein
MVRYRCPHNHWIGLETDRLDCFGKCPSCHADWIVDDEEKKLLANDRDSSYADRAYVLKPGIHASGQKIKNTDEFSFLNN